MVPRLGSRVRSTIGDAGIWGILLAAALATPSPAVAFYSDDLILFTAASTTCWNGGQGLYLHRDSNSLGAWGFNDHASGYSTNSAAWNGYYADNYGAPSIFLTGYDCDLTNNAFPGGGWWNDNISSVLGPN